MKRILIVNHYWPPTGGACVQRWVDFSSYLSELGYNITVLTPENPGFDQMDYTLENRVDDRIKVVKVPYKNIVSGAKKTIGNNKFSLFVRGNLFLPDARKSWNKNAIRFIKQNISDFDIIITAGPPHSAHFIGYYFRNEIKWIADFHDFWTDAIYVKSFNRTIIASLIDKYFEKRILRNADCIFTHSETGKRKYSLLTEKRIEVVPMGFYNKFFCGPNPMVEEGVISHIGTFFENYSDALELIKGYSKKGYRFRQIGPVIGNISFPEGSEIIPYLEHEKAIMYMRKSEILLLINHENFLPGKIFEYIASMRKIELISPAGSDAENLINFNRLRDKESITSDYSRKNIASRIADIIEELTSSSSN